MMKFKGKYNTKTGLSDRWQAALYWNRKKDTVPLVPPEPPEAPIFSGTVQNFFPTVGESFSYDSSVHFYNGGRVSNYTLQNAPSWMSINGLGIISGIPDSAVITNNITITGSNVTGDAVSNTFSTTVEEPAIEAPIFTGTIPDFNEVDGIAITPFDVSSYYNAGDIPDSYTLQNAPSWMSIDNSGIVTGTPDSVGTTNNITVTGTNIGGSTVSNAFDSIVEEFIEIPIFAGIIPDFNEVEDVAITPFDVKPYYSTGGEPTSYSLQNAPSWMSVNSSGIITGTPDAFGTTANVTVTGTNIKGSAVSNSFDAIVEEVAPVFSGTIANFNEVDGIAITPIDVSGNFSTGGAISSYSLQNAPSWMSIDSSGIITGTPDTIGTTNGVTVTGANSADSAVSNTFNVITEAEAPIFSGIIPDFNEDDGAAITPFDVKPYYSTGGAPTSYTLQNAPSWMSINASGIITGTPDSVGTTNNITVTGTNSADSAVSNTFNAVVVAVIDPPIFTGTIPDFNEIIGIAITPYDTSVNYASGGAPTSYSLQNAPSWMSINGSGIISGTPDGLGTTNNITVTGTNAVDSAVSNTFDAIVEVAAPIFTGTISDFNEINGVAITLTDISGNFASGGPVSTYSLQNAPVWMSINNSGVISGTPNGIGTTSNITVTGTNATDSAVSNTFNAVVEVSAPVFTGTIADFNEVVGIAITPTDVSGNFSSGGAVASYSLQNAPAWMSINAAGIISGTPDTEATTNNITVTGTNATDSAVSNTFNAVATAALQAPIFTGNMPDFNETNGIAMTPYDGSIHFSTGGTPDSYSLQNNPAWMSVDNSGVISGTPDSLGDTTGITLTATNATDSATSDTFDVAVTAALQAPIFTGTIADFSEEVDMVMTPYDASVHFSTGGTVASYSLQNAPAWMSIDNTGSITGTPVGDGTTSGVTVTGINAADSAVSNVFDVVVAPVAGDMPVFSGTIPDLSEIIGDNFSYDTSMYYLSGGTPTSYSIQDAPPGITIDNSGVINGIPNDSGTYFKVTVTASNGLGDAVSNDFAFFVQAEYDLSFDGTVYGLLSEPAAYLVGEEYRIIIDQFKIDALPSSDIYLIGEEGTADNYVKINNAGNLIIAIGGQFYSDGAISLGRYYNFEAYNSVAGGMVYAVNDEVVSTQAAAITDFNGKYIGCHSAGSNGFIGTIGIVKLENVTQGTEQEWKFDEGEPQYQSGMNMLENGDFENGFTGGLANGWSITTAIPSEGVGITGAAQEVTNSGGAASVLQRYDGGLTNGQAYIFSGWARVKSGTGTVTLRMVGGLPINTTIGTTSSNEWTHMSAILIATGGAVAYRAYCNDVATVFLVDNCSIRPYQETLSNGNIVIPEEAQGFGTNINVTGEWTVTNGFSETDQIITVDGTQSAWATTKSENGKLYSGLHYVAAETQQYTQGIGRLQFGSSGDFADLNSRSFDEYALIADNEYFAVKDNGNSGTRAALVVKPHANPVPDGVIMYNVEDADWIPTYKSNYDKPLNITVEIPSDNYEFVLPIAGANECNIEWGDGSASYNVFTANPIHTYKMAGTYNIIAWGTIPDISFYGSDAQLLLTRVDNLGVTGLVSVDQAFQVCNNLEYFDVGSTDTSNVTSMNYMMNVWAGMIDPPNLIGLDTKNVTSMASMMKNWTNMISPPDFSSFDTQNAIDMSQMMNGWSSMTTPPDLSSFDTQNAMDMSQMMRYWTGMGAIDISIDIWNVEKAITMEYMLAGTTLTTACYDRVLIAWAAQNVQNDVIVHFGAYTKYTPGGAAEAGRNTLIAKGWIIVDGGSSAVSYFLNPDSEMLTKIESRAESTYNVTIDSENYLAAVNCPWGEDNNLNTVLMTDGNGGGAGSATLAQKLDALSEFITQLDGNDDDETSITVSTMEDFMAAVPYLESGIIDTIISELSIATE